MIQLSKPKVGYLETRAVMDVIRSGQLAQGDVVREFEEQFAKYMGSRYAVACGSGSAALHLANLALGIGKDDDVLTTAFTFPATRNMIKAVGATPVYIDIDNNFNIDVSQIEKRVTNKTKAIIPVHLFGKPCNMKRIMEIAKKHNLTVIEDCAQACGAMINRKKVGTFGDIGIFSFYPTKIITTGEGGMCITNNKNLYHRLKCFRNHGIGGDGFGFNYRMTDMEGAIGLHQLENIDTFITIRRDIASSYNFFLEDYINIPVEGDDYFHVFNNYSFCVKNRKLFILNMNANGIECKIYYDNPLDNLPNALRISKEIVSIPIRPNMTSDEVNHIISNIQNYMEEQKTLENEIQTR